MKHLSSDELLDFVEEGPQVGGHLDECAACRSRLEELRETLAVARDVDMPDPSPLFWVHFSERVKQAIAAEPQPASLGWRARLGVLWPVGVATAFAIALLSVFVFRMGTPVSKEMASQMSTPAESPEGLAQPPITEDASWVLMVDLAAGLDLDSTSDAGLVIRPGSAERAIAQLSNEERHAVTRLLQEELGRAVM